VQRSTSKVKGQGHSVK